MTESLAANDTFFQSLLRLGDDRLVLGHRLSEWCGHGPILEEDIALANTALDLIGQANLLLKLAGGAFQPFLLAGPGWYKRSVEPIEGPAEDLELSTTEFGWHAGGGVELMLGKHAGVHGDYRYTVLDFNDDDDEEIDIGGALGRVLPGHKGSMWTVGVTVYF